MKWQNNKEFKAAMERTLESEGVLSDDVVDRGGVTKYGITIPFLQDYYDSIKERRLTATANAIRALTKDGSILIYYNMIWRKHRFDDMPQIYQQFMFDWIVHSGGLAVRRMQSFMGAHPDGHIGPHTIEAMYASGKNFGNHRTTYNHLVHLRMALAMRIIEQDHTQAKFAVGWEHRIHSFYLFGS